MIKQRVLTEPVLEDGVLTELTEIDPQLVLVFCSIRFLFADDFVAALRAVFSRSVLIGCSTAGEVGLDGVSEGSCVITAVRFEGDARVRLAEAHITDMADSEAAGLYVGKMLASPELRAVLLFGSGVEINGSALIEGVAAQVGLAVPVSGGLAGDDGAFVATLTLSSSGISADGVVAVGFYGDDLIVGHGSFGGWSPFGPAHKVTRCDGNVLHELDGESALNVYKRYLGASANALPAAGLLFPFEMLHSDCSPEGLVRTILGVDEKSGSLIFAGDIHPDGYLRLMHAADAELVDGAAQAARLACRNLPEPRGDALAILVSCVGRKIVMGQRTGREVEAVSRILGRKAAITGFYSYGEIGPFSTTNECRLHNQTMTVTYLSEY